MEFVDHYAVLGVSPSVSQEELRNAYRESARRFHPDVNNSPGAAAAFKSINAAYEVLSDRRERSKYDALWEDYASSVQGVGLNIVTSRRMLRPINEPQLIYALLDIRPQLEMSLATDAPLNLSIVVDRSTSMKGARLQHVKNAVHRIIDECDANDLLSVITFSDRAEVLIPAQHPTDERNLKSIVNSIRADGATAIYSGLTEAMNQIERNRHSRYVNHIVLITDGRTYGDEDDCYRLADEAHELGIGISGMGIGEDWNDRFLDSLASRTGGSSAYVTTAHAVSKFLEERVRSLTTAFAERANLIVAPVANVEIESLVRISPDPLVLTYTDQPIALGALDGNKHLKLVLQLHIDTTNMEEGPCYIGRVDVSAEVLGSGRRQERVLEDLYVTVTEEVEDEEPPPELLEALSRLAMHRLQDRAREAMEEGNVAEATRKLEYLATRLFESGEESLGQTALHEAQQVARTRRLSEEGVKGLKYGTRALMTTILGDDDG